jgi:hypothetical protein
LTEVTTIGGGLKTRELTTADLFRAGEICSGASNDMYVANAVHNGNMLAIITTLVSTTIAEATDDILKLAADICGTSLSDMDDEDLDYLFDMWGVLKEHESYHKLVEEVKLLMAGEELEDGPYDVGKLTIKRGRAFIPVIGRTTRHPLVQGAISRGFSTQDDQTIWAAAVLIAGLGMARKQVEQFFADLVDMTPERFKKEPIDAPVVIFRQLMARADFQNFLRRARTLAPKTS